MLDWSGCYDESWKGLIVDEAFSHPAKFSRGLIQRIYRHAIESGWLAAGAMVVDPFGGVALGALDAMQAGVLWRGCELESRFVELGRQNLAKWGRCGLTGGAIVQGDSRNLCAVLGAMADCVCSSPPYAESVNAQAHGIDWTKAGPATGNRKRGEGCKHEETLRAQMKYADCSEGQLGAMRPGSVEAVVSSPPYTGDVHLTEMPNRFQSHRDPAGKPAAECRHDQYGATAGNLGRLPAGNADTVETFWSAAREIVVQCFQIIRSGGVAIWVCKDFVRKGQRVPFSADWQRLCLSVGFEPLEWIRASLVKEIRHAGLFDGEEIVKTKERKSFFRRLAEKKGSPAINHEDVIIVRKP
jgi:hypothetical protein